MLETLRKHREKNQENYQLSKNVYTVDAKNTLINRQVNQSFDRKTSAENTIKQQKPVSFM